MEPGNLTPQEQLELETLLNHAKAGDHYALLGIDSNANKQAVQKAYYGLSRKWHPDRHFRRKLGKSQESIVFIFIQITTAYKVLGDEKTRRNFDLTYRPSRRHRELRTRGTRRTNKTQESLTRNLSRSSNTAPSEESIKRQEERKKKRAQGYSQLRQQVHGRSSRARTHFAQGKKEYEDGKVNAAVGSLHLACEFEPKNTEFKELYRQVRKEARALQSKALLATAENAESFQNYREAIATYEKAAKLDPAEGLVFHRLGMLLQRVENDPRRALHLLRTAVTKSPDSVQFRLDLGDLYGELEMALNARREFQEVLKLDKKNTRAKNSLRALR
jgi:curved DNA-binding protein CbpA